MIPWPVLIQLIVQYGIPGAYEIWKIIDKHPQPTDEAWNAMLALNTKPLSQYVIEAGGTPPVTVPGPPISIPPPPTFPV